jgi:hypothetical protein
MAPPVPTIEGVLDLAHRLPRKDQAELIARLARMLATAPPEETPTSTVVAAAWAKLRADLSTRPTGATSMAEQLEADRRDRDRLLQGQAEGKAS